MKSIFFFPLLTLAVILLFLPDIRGQSKNSHYVINSSGSVNTSVGKTKYLEYSMGEFFVTDGSSTNKTIVGICQANYMYNSLPSLFDQYFKIQVFPNPVQSILSIETDYTGFKRTRIMNETGQILKETNFEKNINMAELPIGIFLIQFITDETQFTKSIKIIKQ